MPISDVSKFFESLGNAALKAEIRTLLQAKQFAEVVKRAEVAGFKFTVSELQAHTPAEFFAGIAHAANTVGSVVVKEAETVGDEIGQAANSAEKWVVSEAQIVGNWVVGAANTVGNEVVDLAQKAGNALNPTHW